MQCSAAIAAWKGRTGKRERGAGRAAHCSLTRFVPSPMSLRGDEDLHADAAMPTWNTSSASVGNVKSAHNGEFKDSNAFGMLEPIISKTATNDLFVYKEKEVRNCSKLLIK